MAQVDELQFVHLGTSDIGRLVSLGFDRLRSLRLRDLRASDLAFLGAFPHLDSLSIWQSAKVTSLSGIQALQGLRELGLSELGPLPSLVPLSALEDLQELYLSGGVWKDQKLSGDFSPLATLENLRRLTITNVRGPVDLTPLSRYQHLERLSLATALFPTGEVARLAAAYPFWHQQRPWLHPLPISRGVYGCSRCGGEQTLLLLQRTRGIWCERCDADKLSRILEKFEQLIQQCGSSAP
ncbi:MAG: hypothetical protein IPP47_15735 [Bryobacterales bacterium]|nr:hypothetical protein [Bryobacterales bacterium]